VTLTGLHADPVGPIYAEHLYATDTAGSADPAHLHPFAAMRLDPKGSAIVVVQWHLDCKDEGKGVESSTGDVRLRYRYLSMFSRTQEVELPFAVTLRCSGGPPASP